MRARLARTALFTLALIACSGLFFGFTYFYTSAITEAAIRQGLYDTPEAAMRAQIEESWVGIQRIEIERSGTNSFDGSNPHVGFVIAKVWADSRSDGSAISDRGFDYPGSYFLQTGKGWVLIPEGRFPDFIGWGMRIFRIYGCEGKDSRCENPF